MELNQIEIAASLLGTIDSGERSILLDVVNTENQVEAKILIHDGITGVFFSCYIFDGLRIDIALENDTDAFNDEMAALIQSTLRSSGFTSCSIWIRNENTKIIEFLKKRFQVQPDCGAYYYASNEFIMRREMFDKPANKSALDIRPYEEKHLKKYLLLLDEAMTFASPPPNFRENESSCAKFFSELADKIPLKLFGMETP